MSASPHNAPRDLAPDAVPAVLKQVRQDSMPDRAADCPTGRPRDGEQDNPQDCPHDLVSCDIVLATPLSGRLVPLVALPDPALARGLFGDGEGIAPLEGLLVAPCDGTVSHLARGVQALMLTAVNGARILLHIGIDTVDLKGRGFAARVAQGAPVCVGDVLVEFDMDYVGYLAYSLISLITLVYGEDYEIVTRAASGMLRAGRTALMTVRRRGARPAGAAPVADAAGRASAARVLSMPSTPSTASPFMAHIPTASNVNYRASVTLSRPCVHARPAAHARAVARRFDARLHVEFEGRHASLDSIVGLRSLGAGHEAQVTVAGSGAQAREAVRAVCEALTCIDAPVLDDVSAEPARDHGLGPARADEQRLRLAERAITRDGPPIEVSARIATLDDARLAVRNGAETIDVPRESCFTHYARAPTPAEQQYAYQRLVDALDGRAATICLLGVQGVGALGAACTDKAVDDLTSPAAPDPASGMRAVRTAQPWPEQFDDQLRGLLSVQSAAGAVRALAPAVPGCGRTSAPARAYSRAGAAIGSP